MILRLLVRAIQRLKLIGGKEIRSKESHSQLKVNEKSKVGKFSQTGVVTP